MKTRTRRSHKLITERMEGRNFLNTKLGNFQEQMKKSRNIYRKNIHTCTCSKGTEHHNLKGDLERNQKRSSAKK